MDSAELEQIVVRLSDDRETSLASLIKAWGQHVAYIHREMSLENSERAWTADDLVAALILRDKISETLIVRPDLVLIANSSGLATADAEFRSISQDDPLTLISHFALSEATPNW